MPKPEKSHINLRPILACALLMISVGACTSCGKSRRAAATPGTPASPSTRTASLPGHVLGPTIRVACLKVAHALRITGGSAPRLSAADGRVIQQFPDGALLDIQATPSGMAVNGVPLNETALSLESASGGVYFAVNGQEIAPKLVLHRDSGQGQTLTVVAQLGIEDYLQGVLAGEVPFERWHPEALKAQAIASRSYAYFQTRAHAADPYDVESTVMSQVFKAGYRDNPILYSACAATRGLVLTCDGKCFPAYFHSTCGGMTAPAAEVFPAFAQVKALHGSHCPYCTQSPHYRWRMTMSKDALAAKLRARYPGIKSIDRLEFLDADGRLLGAGSGIGRAALVRIHHSGGTMQMQGNAFRLLAGPGELKSLLLSEVSDRGDHIEIAGGGFGHGVGLCQFGSEGMARSGRGYAEILGLYFPGAELAKMW